MALVVAAAVAAVVAAAAAAVVADRWAKTKLAGETATAASEASPREAAAAATAAAATTTVGNEPTENQRAQPRRERVASRVMSGDTTSTKSVDPSFTWADTRPHRSPPPMSDAAKNANANGRRRRRRRIRTPRPRRRVAANEAALRVEVLTETAEAEAVAVAARGSTTRRYVFGVRRPEPRGPAAGNVAPRRRRLR
jgi:hypothetical protein